MPNPSEILKQKRAEALKIAEKYKVKNLRIFGSVARGEDDEESDIDLLASFPEGFTLFDLVDLVKEIEELLGCKVDIASERGLKERVRARILNEAIPI
ncbi:nucleotidyltransferase family protein [bacterium]|nr:nucleotidyltransferase family protein [FCB group bacterium]MBL7191813.1 nucleotidyltransferase family protein [bacterium]